MNKKYCMKALPTASDDSFYYPGPACYNREQADRDKFYLCDQAGSWGGAADAAVTKLVTRNLYEYIFGSDFLNHTSFVKETDIVDRILTLLQKKFSPNGKTLTNRQLLLAYKLLLDIGPFGSKFDQAQMASFAKLLSIKGDMPLVSGQYVNPKDSTEYFYFLCPAALLDKIPFIGAVYFNTGMTWRIYDIPVGLDSPKDHLNDKVYYEGYTELSTDNELRKWAAEIKNCSPDEIEILR